MQQWDVFLIAALFFIGCFLWLFLAVEPGLVYFSFGDLCGDVRGLVLCRRRREPCLCASCRDL